MRYLLFSSICVAALMAQPQPYNISAGDGGVSVNGGGTTITANDGGVSVKTGERRALKKAIGSVIDKKLDAIYRMLGEIQTNKVRAKKKKEIKKPLTIDGFLKIENHLSGEKIEQVLATDDTGRKVYLDKKNDRGMAAINFRHEYVKYKDGKRLKKTYAEAGKSGEAAPPPLPPAEGDRLEVEAQPIPIPVPPVAQEPKSKPVGDIVNEF